MFINERNWTVLFIGGASGTGKSSIAYELARFHGVNVLEVDDIHLSVEAATKKDDFPAIHHWSGGENWEEVGVQYNVKWLRDVGKELAPILKAVAERHIEDRLPIIIEGDFINPEFLSSFEHPEIKSIFVIESDKNQIAKNYLSREGGELQNYRAEISVAYNNWIIDMCKQKGLCMIDSRPWNTAIERINKIIL
jgi:2-phosphoglycerate kinase